MIHKRNLTFEHSFQEIKSKASPEQRKYIFENIAILQNNFRSNHTNIKKGHPLEEYADKTTSLHEETMSPKKRSSNSRMPLQDKPMGSISNDTLTSSRIPLANMDLNSMQSEYSEGRSNYGIWKLSKRDRTRRAKEKKHK